METILVLVVGGWLLYELMRKSPTTTAGSVLWLIVYVPLCLLFMVMLVMGALSVSCEVSDCLRGVP